MVVSLACEAGGAGSIPVQHPMTPENFKEMTERLKAVGFKVYKRKRGEKYYIRLVGDGQGIPDIWKWPKLSEIIYPYLPKTYQERCCADGGVLGLTSGGGNKYTVRIQ